MPHTSPAQAYVDDAVPMAQDEKAQQVMQDLMQRYTEAEPMNLSMFSHEFLAILVVGTLGAAVPLFERSWIQYPVSLSK